MLTKLARTYHHAELCSQHDNCLSETCGMGGNPNPSHPNQWWRYLTPVFLHVGILHFVFNAVYQLQIGIPVCGRNVCAMQVPLNGRSLRSVY